MLLAYRARQLSSLRPLLSSWSCDTVHACTRTFASAAKEERMLGVSPWVVSGGLLAAVGGITLLAEELETRKAVATLEAGFKLRAASNDKALERAHVQSRLVDLLHPYVCSMSHVDIVFGHAGSGKSAAVQRAVDAPPGGALYVDLRGDGNVGGHVLEVLTGEQSRGLFQRFRDLIRGGQDAHGRKILETAVERYVRRHERYPVVAFDHVDPKECNFGAPDCFLLHLGRSLDAESPSLRQILVLDDAGLEVLHREALQSTDFRLVQLPDPSEDEALRLLQQHNVPRELSQQVVRLVGGRLSHLHEAVSYWSESPRWLSPMRPGASADDYAASIQGHFAEIKKLIYWDLDKRLRISAGIALWPAATGDAPVSHQSPTDEDAMRIVQLLGEIHSAPLLASNVRAAIGETRFLQLLRAGVLGFEPQEGPLTSSSDLLVSFGSPAMQQYFVERLLEARKEAGTSSGQKTLSKLVFGGK